MNKPRLTTAVRRGLKVLEGLVRADIEFATDYETRWNAQERQEIDRALEWLRAVAYDDGKAATGSGEPSQE